MPLDPGNNTKAAGDFLEVVLHAHIVAAAESLCNTSSGNLTELSEAVVNKFVKVVLILPQLEIPRQGSQFNQNRRPSISLCYRSS